MKQITAKTLFLILLIAPSMAFATTNSKCPSDTGYTFINDRDRNPTNGGFVSHGASVSDRAFIAPTAAICDSATIEGSARVYGNAVVKDEAEVSSRAKVYGDAIVMGEAIITDKAKVSGNAIISGDAVIKGDARVKGYARISSGTIQSGKHNPSKPAAMIEAEQRAGQRAERAKILTRQNKLARQLGGEMVSLEGGCFMMGSSSPETYRNRNEKPVHEVCLDPFSIGKYEITNKQYRQYKKNHDSGDDIDRVNDSVFEFNLNADSQPAVNVSWNDATGFAKWLSEQTGRNYRLPTEAEWEYSARGGSSTSRFWGDSTTKTCKYGNVYGGDLEKFHNEKGFYSMIGSDSVCIDGYVASAPVGSYKPNAFGLHDMIGNAWEWTSDWYASQYYSTSPKKNPRGPNSGEKHVVRGLGWDGSMDKTRSSFRHYEGGAYVSRGESIGFRLVQAD